MAVSKTNYGTVIVLKGTIAEVAQALSDNQVSMGNIISVDTDGTTNAVAFYKV